MQTALTAHIAIDRGVNAQQVLAAAIAKIRDRYTTPVRCVHYAVLNTEHRIQIGHKV